MKYILPALSYEYDALEPFIDKQTMQIHHTKHHQTYVDKLNAVLEKYPKLADRKLEDLMRNLKTLEMDEKDRTLLQNHGGGHLNHSFFWTIMGKEKKTDQNLVSHITKAFGSVDEFKKMFSEKAVGLFGSGWAWLVEDAKRELMITTTPNQNSPYVSMQRPLIGLDVWEHAYYLKYQNKRPEYVQNWWNVLTLI